MTPPPTTTRYVIVDSSVLIFLHQLELGHVLGQIYGAVVAPQTVIDEVTRENPGDVPAQASIPWLHVHPAPPAPPELARFRLDAGEEAVLAMALASSTDVVLLLDDRDARDAADALGIVDHPGTLGVLLVAKEKGFIALVRPYIEALQGLNFYASDGLYQHVLERAGEG